MNYQQLCEQFFEEVLNQGDTTTLDKFITSDWANHYMAAQLPPGFAGLQQWVTTIHTAFPDIHYTIEDIFTANDKVVTRVLVTGTHQGDFMGAPPTGHPFRITGINIDRFANGKMVEHWAEYDMVALMRQLGLAPPPQ